MARNGLIWRVETVNDLGEQEQHRWHVTGRIIDGTLEDGNPVDRGHFNWRVPSLLDPAYEFPNGKPPFIT